MENILSLKSLNNEDSMASKRETVMANVLLILLHVGVIESIFTFIFQWINSLTNFPYEWTNIISKILYFSAALFIVADLIIILFHKKVLNKSYIMNKFILILLILAVSTLLFYYSYATFTGFEAIIYTNYVVYITNGLLVFYVALNIERPISIFRNFKPYIWISLVFLFLYATIYTGRDIGMNIAYGVLPSALMSFIYAIRSTKSKAIIYIILCVLFNLGLIVLGNRWSMLISFIFMGFILVLFMNKKLLVKTSLIVGTSIICLLLAVMAFEELIKSFVPNLRIVDLVQSSELFADNVRMNLWRNGLYESLRNPIAIKGVLYDRYFYTMTFNGNSNLGIPIYDASFNGIFAHNLLVEVVMQFGWLFGGVMLVFLGIVILYSFFRAKSITRIMVVMLVFAGFMQLIVSNSYLISCWFWGGLGVLVNFASSQVYINMIMIDNFTKLNEYE